MANRDEETTIDPRGLPEGIETALAEFLSTSEDGDDTDMARFEALAGRVQEFLAEQNGGYNKIDTHSGKKITPLDPDPDNIRIEDIAHGLSNIGRFAGQGREFYSVARHSIHVSYEVEVRGGGPSAQRYALLHDAAEAYLSDVPGPVKRSLPGYKHAERRVDRAVVRALDLDVSEKGRELVEEADTVVGQHELATQFPDRGHDGAELEHDADEAIDETEAKVPFLYRATDLGLR